jgi:type IV pilus biogenesis protein CpaD/CtpE
MGVNMERIMKAKYKGVCCKTGAPINVGDIVVYDTVTRKVWLTVDEDRMFVTIS